MRTIRVTNARPRALVMPNGAVVAPYAYKDVSFDEFAWQDCEEQLLLRLPYIGGYTFGGALTQVELRSRAALQQSVSGAAAIAATVRSVLVSSTATATLPAANAVPAGTIIDFFAYSTGAAVTATIARAGADTINGGTASIVRVSTDPIPAASLQSNGVDGWITL